MKIQFLDQDQTIIYKFITTVQIEFLTTKCCQSSLPAYIVRKQPPRTCIFMRLCCWQFTYLLTTLYVLHKEIIQCPNKSNNHYELQNLFIKSNYSNPAQQANFVPIIFLHLFIVHIKVKPERNGKYALKPHPHVQLMSTKWQTGL